MRLAARVTRPSAMGRPVASAGLVELAHRHGLRVQVWTVDAVDDIERLLDLGVDGLMTDQVTALRAALVERRRWQP